MWLLTDSTNKLSNDRLRRVQFQPKETLRPLSGLTKRIKQSEFASQSDSFSISELAFCSKEIKIGDFCAFQFDFEYNLSVDSSTEHAVENIIIGTILGFRYIGRKTAKDRRYNKDTAIIDRDDKDNGIEAFSLWRPVQTAFLFPLKNICSQ